MDIDTGAAAARYLRQLHSLAASRSALVGVVRPPGPFALRCAASRRSLLWMLSPPPAPRPPPQPSERSATAALAELTPNKREPRVVPILPCHLPQSTWLPSQAHAPSILSGRSERLDRGVAYREADRIYLHMYSTYLCMYVHRCLVESAGCASEWSGGSRSTLRLTG